MNYTDLVNTISNLVVISPTDPNFVQIFPQGITYSEDRLYRELDLLSTVTRDNAPLVASNRNFTLPSNNGRFVVTNGFNIITPAGTTVPDSGSRTQMIPVSRDYLDAVWGSVAGTGLPTQYAMITDQTIIVGPWPDQNYTLEVVGTIQPAQLSATNTTTFLSLYLPDLLTAAMMIFMSGFQRDFGAQSDDPAQAQSWQSQYDKLFASALTVELRKKYASGAWASLSATPTATPSR